MEIPVPPRDDPEAAARWVDDHLDGLSGDGPARPSPAVRGGQTAADAALAGWSVAGYAGARNQVWPEERRGASRQSPYVRHGLIDLPRLWGHVAGGPSNRDSAVSMAETLGDLAARRELTVLRGDPVALLRDRRVAVTFAPVPGFRRRAAAIRPAMVHPWPWLRRPHEGSVASFSAWVRRARA